MEKNKKIVSISLDREVLDRLNTAHAESGILSRSRYVENLINHALNDGGVDDGKEEKPADVSGQ